jgi:dTDP-4-amino-4,6-dideoxygalactose transaminase
MILCGNPKAQYLAHKKEIDQAINDVLMSGWYVLGKEVQKFEEEFAKYIGVSHAIGVGSGTEALHIALKASGVKAGDEVITVSHTAVATISAIECAGATPVLVDIEPDYYCIDPQKLRNAITSKTKAVIAVHLYGQAADLQLIQAICQEKELLLIEDCAQAHGAKYHGKRVGSFGDVACFSFYPTKNLGAIGDGGMVVSNQPKIAENAALFREYGWKERYISELSGWNSRLDELQAAVLRVKLRYLDQDNELRETIANKYSATLQEIDGQLPLTRNGNRHVYHLYVLRHQKRDELIQYLRSHGIAPGIHYPQPVHLQAAYKGKIQLGGGLLETERASLEVLSLPLYPELEEEQVKTVVKKIIEFGKN